MGPAPGRRRHRSSMRAPDASGRARKRAQAVGASPLSSAAAAAAAAPAAGAAAPAASVTLMGVDTAAAAGAVVSGSGGSSSSSSGSASGMRRRPSGSTEAAVAAAGAAAATAAAVVSAACAPAGEVAAGAVPPVPPPAVQRKRVRVTSSQSQPQSAAVDPLLSASAMQWAPSTLALMFPLDALLPRPDELMRMTRDEVLAEFHKTVRDVRELEDEIYSMRGNDTMPGSAAAALPAASASAGAVGAPAAGAAAASGSDVASSRTDAASEEELEEYRVPEHCVPIRADVTRFDWAALAAAVQFDVIMMDPPWQLASALPTRGVALGYEQLPDRDIERIPVESLQQNGYLFVWVINARYAWTLDAMTAKGYEFVDEVTWVKRTVNRRLAKGHGFYLQHAKESCLMFRKGADPPGTRRGVCGDVIYSERRGQSQKPEEMYDIIEQLVPNGTYLEIFARRNNLRDYWVSIGIEL